ncbi:uncharacterized protein AB9W97_022253 [Spinachia spinachia]
MRIRRKLELYPAKQELDEALVSMIVKDTQPCSIVDDVGFRAFVFKLDPNYVLPTRQALKAMVGAKYDSAKEKAMANVEKVPASKVVPHQTVLENPSGVLGETCSCILVHASIFSTL